MSSSECELHLPHSKMFQPFLSFAVLYRFLLPDRRAMRNTSSLWTALCLVLLSCQTKVDLDTVIMEGEDTAICWMTGLADETPVTSLSIPGAHDAASSTITAFKRWTRTQELNVAELWNCGVRAFDLRPAWVDGEMGLYHDKYSAHVSFPAVMRSLVLALERHPGEGAIVLIRHEEEADGNSPEWAAEMGQCLQELRPHLASWHPGMTLADLRGKILVLSRNRYDGGPMGAYIEGWTSGTDAGAQRGATLVDASGSRSPVWVQDYYKPAGADDKWTEIRALLDAASTAADPSPLVVNHVSGYIGKLPDYRANAQNVNGKAAEYIRSMNGPVGIVMMDFAGVSMSAGKKVSGKELVEALIGNQ